MTTLTEIKTAADALPPEQQLELLLFLAARLRAGSMAFPAPRKFSRNQLKAWIADDEEGMRRHENPSRQDLEPPAWQ